MALISRGHPISPYLAVTRGEVVVRVTGAQQLSINRVIAPSILECHTNRVFYCRLAQVYKALSVIYKGLLLTNKGSSKA